MIELSIREMMHRGVHFGHKKQYWNPEMEPYIFGTHQKLHIINLELTQPMLMNAFSFVEQVIQRKGKIVFVGTKYAAQDVVVEQAMRCGMPYVNRRWLGGMLTNFKTIRKSVKRLKQLETQEELNAFEGMTKKERLVLQREQNKLFSLVGGIKDMESLPSALFVLDVGQDAIAVKEANKLGIPVVGIVDTNNSPQGIDYIVPGNDDAMSALDFYTTLVADVIQGTQLKLAEEEKLAAERLQAEMGAVADKKPAVKKVTKKSREASSDKTENEKSKPVKNVTQEKQETQVSSPDTEKSISTEPPEKAALDPLKKEGAADAPAFDKAAPKGTSSAKKHNKSVGKKSSVGVVTKDSNEHGKEKE